MRKPRAAIKGTGGRVVLDVRQPQLSVNGGTVLAPPSATSTSLLSASGATASASGSVRASRTRLSRFTTASTPDPPSSGGQDKPSVISEGKEAVKDGTRTIGHFFRDTAQAIGHGARDAGRAVGEAAKGTGDAASDVWRKVTGDAPK